jgi:lysine-specific histone demethylase 1
MEYARQSRLAAYSSRLNPFALHPDEYQLLRDHITKPQVTIYLQIRNGILRLWHRNPLVAVTRDEAAGCAKESKHFPLAQVSYEWLFRNGYINFGCVDIPQTKSSLPSTKKTQKTVVVIGAGMSGLGCARHLEALFNHYADEFNKLNQKPPKVIILEGRKRIGGRVFSHPLVKQGGLPFGMRSTAEMGAQIITGFEHGNPLSFIIRGQLAIPYHTLRDDSVLYDYDGIPVNHEKDESNQHLWNYVLERAATFRNELPTVLTVEGDQRVLQMGLNVKETSDQMLASLEESGDLVTIQDGNPVSTNKDIPEDSAVGVDKVAGRNYQLARLKPGQTASQAAKEMGWTLKPGVKETDDIDLDTISKSMDNPSLGAALDDGIRQFQDLINITAQDLRLFNWHHANMEYANASVLDDLSLGGWDQDVGNEFEGRHASVIGGYTQVPRGLWRLPKPLDVRLDQEARSIIVPDDESPLSVVTRKATVTADKVVVTIPLGVLKEESLKFQPPLPDWKTGCIERMGFGLLNKVGCTPLLVLTSVLI